MVVNLIVILLILTFGAIYKRGSSEQYNKAENRKRYIKLICFILILQSGLRNVAVGSDTYQYFRIFEGLKTTSWSVIFKSISDYYQLGLGKDPGYLIFQKTIQIFTGEYQIFLFVIAIIFFTALGNFIYRNTNRLSDAILAFVIYSVLFYGFFSITGVRQTLATAATLFGYELIKRKKLLPFIILILLASTIHKSALVFLPFYFIVQIKNPKYLFAGVLILFPILMIFRNSLSEFFQIIGGYYDYVEYEGAGTFTFTLMFIVLSITAWWRRKYILNINTKDFYIAFALALLFLPLTWVNPNGMRVVQYFSIFMLVLVPAILYSFQAISVKVRKDIYRVTVLILLILFLQSNWNNPNPYGFFWEEMRLGENYL